MCRKKASFPVYLLCLFMSLSCSLYSQDSVLEDAESMLRNECYHECIQHLDGFDLADISTNSKCRYSWIIGEASLYLRDYAKALEHFTIVYSFGGSPHYDKATSRLAYLFYLSGENEKSIDLLEQLEVAPFTILAKSKGIILTRAYTNMKQYDKAHLTIDKSYTSFRSADLLIEKANIYIKSNQFSNASELYKDLIEIQKDEVHFLYYNNLLYSLNRCDLLEAEKMYKRIDDLLMRREKLIGFDSAREAIYYQNKAEFLSTKGCHADAIGLIDKAIVTYFGVDREEQIDLRAERDKQSLLDFYDAKIEIYTAADHPSIDQVFYNVDEICFYMRMEAVEDDIRFRKAIDYAPYYQRSFQYFQTKNRVEEAYYFISQTKDAALLEDMKYKYGDTELSYRNLRMQLSKMAIESKMDDDTLNSARIKTLNSFVGAKNPIANTEFDLIATQDRIPAFSVLLDYFKVDTSLFVFVISRDDIQLYPLSPIDSHEVEVYKQQIGRRPSIQSWGKEEKLRLSKAQEQLGSSLLPSVVEDYQKVIIIPTAELCGLNFETLRYKGRLMVDSHYVSYCSSVGLLGQVMDKYGEHVGNSVLSKNGDLAGSANEIETILGKYAFTKTTLKKVNFSGDAVNILHFSNHGYYDNGNRYLSKIQVNGGELAIKDILNLDIMCNLVFLAGCSTGEGEYIQTEGVYGLSRSFFLAGAKSVICSFYEINDASSNRITLATYEYLSKGYNSVESLTLAKRKYLSQETYFNQHPYYWAGMVVEGNPNIKMVERPRAKFSSVLGW